MKKTIACLKSRFLVFFYDVIMIPLALFGAYWLRFNLGDIPSDTLKQAITILPLLMAVQITVYWTFGLYRGIWSFASLPDLVRIVKATIAAIFLCIVLAFLDGRLMHIPRSILPLYGLLLIMLLGGSRFLYRWFKDSIEKENKNLSHEQRLLIIGAGRAGESIVRDLQRHINQQYQAVAFIDDRPSKKGQEIHGIRVVGNSEDIPIIVKNFHIDLIIIAMPSVSSADMRRVVGYCEQSGVPFRTLPSLSDLANGSVKIEALREVSLEDLLGRDPVMLDWENIRRNIANKTVLISGGGGSIGAELCRQIAHLYPKKIIVIEQNEFNLYLLELEFKQKFSKIDFCGHLVDVTDVTAVKQVIAENNIDMVFHAAAYKHVPLLENHLRAAVRNNILGTKILAEATVEAKIQKFVLISTDKAVNPTNIMGATKRAAEIFCQNYNSSSSTQFITVRFGNVLGSAGSVVPLFRKQIEAGGPLTVTHPEITRFFMTIREATQLILQAMVLGEGGEIFVLDMGDPIKIGYLAEQMIILAGLTPYKDIEIIYTGLRPGEKLYEELFHESEMLTHTQHEKILRAAYREKKWQDLLLIVNNISLACAENDEQTLIQLLLTLVPEYQGKQAQVTELLST